MKLNSFKDDYSEGCHPSILDMLQKTNLEQQYGYGDDEYSLKAKEFIKQKAVNSNLNIYFTSGGTQANLIVISSALRLHESVISACTGHISVNEAGAIEATGHKVNTIVSSNGKVRIEDIQKVLDDHSHVPHVVKPKMVYISNSTEIGTIYQKQELTDLYEFCQKNSLYLFLDGARLGSALCSSASDLLLEDIARLTDIFYIGGTKNGALLGEAIVISNERLKEDFAYYLKQKGALMSKGRLLGIQFFVLFKDNLFFDLAKHANKMAEKLTNAIKKENYNFLIESQTNQIFPILPNALIEKLEKKFEFYVWKEIDTKNSAIRLVTSWATQENSVDEFIDELVSK